MLAQLYDREPEILSHAAVAELLGLGYACFVGGSRLVFAPETGECVAQAQVRVALVVASL